MFRTIAEKLDFLNRQLNNNNMETKYSKQEFEGYTHRFIVRLHLNGDWGDDLDINIYSNSDSKEDLTEFINQNKREVLTGFTITHRASKEQDEATTKFLMNF